MEGDGFAERPTAFAAPVDQGALSQGARNLLLGCAEVRPGQRVVLLHEDPYLGWYDVAAPTAVARMAGELGATVDLLEVGGPDTPLQADARSLQSQADVLIWFARIGDQDRFAVPAPGQTIVVSYARTASTLASSFGTTPHADMVALKHAVDDRLAAAEVITVTCAHGTRLAGSQAAGVAEDVTVRRFPMCVPRPVPAAQFNGTVALRGYLSPTGSRSYRPADLKLAATVMAHIHKGRIVDFEGNPDTVARIRAHYTHVAGLFAIEPDVVHSWHAGIHAGCTFDGLPDQNADLWSNSVFGSPRWLHFHTCGNYAPGEICWMVEEPTVFADEEPIWSAGRLALDATGAG
ncbi:MAG: hypothetical protein AAF409_17045 [Pseudomonadota bacterium]